MNTILPLNRLAEMLASRAGIDKAAAENFIVRLFETIENGLVAGETVTVKGFGTFRVEDDNVVFEPSDEYAAAVNAPFEMFAPVTIGSDVDTSTLFAPIDEPVGEESAEEPAEEEPPVAVVEEPVVEEPVVEEPADEPVVEEPVVEPVVVEETPATVDEPIADDEPVIEEEPIADDEPEEESSADTDDVIRVDEHDSVRRRGVSRCCIVLWLIVGLIVGMIVGVCGGYFGHDKIDMLLDRTTTVATTPVDSLTGGKTEQPIDTMPVELTDSDIADINDPNTDPENVAKVEAVKPVAPVEVYDTITSRRFLTTMARKYYGHQDYWVYIYKANSSKLRHPDKIRPGTRVLIPDFEKYRTSSDPEQNRIDARREGVRIYDKYSTTKSRN